MKKILAALMVLAGMVLSGPASALTPPVTMETNWTWNVAFTSFTGVASKTVDACGLGSAGYSKKLPNCVGHAYAVYALGADAQFTISQTTKTPNSATAPTSFTNPSPFSLAITAPVISTTSAILALNGIPLSGTFSDLTVNPVFNFSPLSTAATTYVWLEYGIQKQQ